MTNGIIRDQLQRVLRAYEHLTGMGVCFRSLSGRWRADGESPLLSGDLSLHTTPFCNSRKRADVKACKKSCASDVLRESDAAGDVFLRTCHAGAQEAMAPVFLGQQLVGVVHLGPFRTTDARPAELPYRSLEEVHVLLDLLRPLATYLADVLDRIELTREQANVGRGAEIERFLDSHLSSDPGLKDLADHLHLSPGRTSHLVRETTRRSFRELKESRRLETARHLLLQTSAKIAAVAMEVGFSDPAYFCRYFKAKAGMTPSEYRKRHTSGLGI